VCTCRVLLLLLLLLLLLVYHVPKFSPFPIEIVGLGNPARYIGDFSLLNVCSYSKTYPSARFTSVGEAVSREVDVFGAERVFFSS
jgi:hypothetical protein